MSLFQALADPTRKNTYEIEALHKMLELKKHRTQRNMVAEAVRSGKSSRGGIHTENSRRWAAIRELVGFSVVDLQETTLSEDGHLIAEHLQAIENIIALRQRQASSRINIYSPASLLAQFVLPKLGSFVREILYASRPSRSPQPFPDSRIHCWERGTYATWVALRDDLADVILIRNSFLKTLNKGERNLLHHKDLGHEGYAWVLPSGKTKINLVQGSIPMVRIGGEAGEINQTLKKKAPRIDWRVNVSDFSGVLNMLEADSSFGGLLPAPMATTFVEGRKRSSHTLIPCLEYPSARISLVCKKANYKSQLKVKEIFEWIAKT